ncbi:MAG: 1,3-beta-galactosyl-N-acetylhexosamine phosphorylase [Actinomycetaceae bacterium]|nr:1,3-beta-galactosyl-N-acetylhexosamine phosphorylase [Arcanobacterium sp.]MDD7504622.1 1,3-beta-galactosyl-N-acetylhexosamine phosphorylase [Actinomycetaceae bacterium]
MSEGRLTLPIETGMDDEIRALVARLRPDAVRNSDGTELPEIAKELVDKVYSTYFPSRGDHEWSRSHPGQRVHQYLMSERVTAFSSDPLEINVMRGYFTQQFAPELDCDLTKYWQVIDRTTGETLPPDQWSVAAAPAIPVDKEREAANSGPLDEEAGSAVVTISQPEAMHVYTVNFLARQIWDSTQIYNYLTNNWADNPNKLKDKTYDPSYAETWDHVQHALDEWLGEHPEVDVVRFTAFFYHFTLVFNDQALEKYVDWFGYSAAVSVPALEDFEQTYGYALTPEDFIDAGYYNSPFRVPNPHFRDWMEFTSRSVSEKARALVSQVHDAGREAMMFLGDNWIGTEPYGEYFPSIGLDAVVGSVGNACTCRMISDIPGVKYTEGRFLPYFFPDVFNPEGDPIGEAEDSWVTARRAIARHPLDRIGYGGYLSLATQFPEFIDRIEQIVNEFRSIHELGGGALPQNAPITVAILNVWGKLRTWQTHMVAHALWYREIYSYQGVIESLAGLPFDVRFIDFDDVRSGALDEVDVVINAGTMGTGFIGGNEWEDLDVQTAVRSFVANGGGLIGVGQPTSVDHAYAARHGVTFALADVLGVDQEIDFGLSRDKYSDLVAEHFINTDLDASGDKGAKSHDHVPFDTGEGMNGVWAFDANTQELARENGGIAAAAHEFGKGRSVYFSGLPYSIRNSRMLHRAIFWAAGKDGEWDDSWVSNNPAIELAYFPKQAKLFATNVSKEAQRGVITGENGYRHEVDIAPLGSEWIEIK